jgi:hypothetical protein
MDVIVVQSEGSVKFLAFELVLLEVFIRADIADYASVGIVMGDLLDRSITVHDHAVIAHIVLNVVVPSIDGVIAE